MTKALSKSIMERTRFRNKYLKNPLVENRLVYTRITLAKNEEVISDDVEVANALNSFFSNTVKIVKCSEKYADNNVPHSLLRHPILNSMLIYKDHPSIRIIKRVYQGFSSFYFSPFDQKTVLK